MKKIIIDGSEIEVIDYKWITEQPKIINKISYRVEILPFIIDHIKVKICRQNCKKLLQKILFTNEYVIETDGKKAKFYLCGDEIKKLFDWHKSESDEIEINFIGTCNDVD